MANKKRLNKEEKITDILKKLGHTSGITMFNKEKCRKCKYYSVLDGGWYDNGSDDRIFCNYSSCTGNTCTKRQNGKIIDIRGNDPENCKLFESGKRIKTRIDSYGLSVGGWNSTRKSEQDKLELINKWSKSGLTAYEWCQRNGIRTKTFYFWIQEFRKKGYNIPDGRKKKRKDRLKNE